MEDKKHHIREETEMSIDNEPDKINVSKFNADVKKNPWMLSTIILGIAVLILLFFVLRGGITGNVIDGGDAGSKTVDYLNARTGGGVEYISYSDIGNLYEVIVLYKNQKIPVYVTKDGKYFVQSAIPITGNVVDNSQQQETLLEIPKTDKPKVELFVMTYCPYGTQAEKGLIPVLELLKDKIDAKIRFVHYFIHGDKEEKETYQQLCIREEQLDRYLNYLKCFLEAGDSEGCLDKATIDKTKLNLCITNKAKEYYKADSVLSQKYGVQGSPTLVINGVEARSERDSADYLSVICSAFNDVPDECKEKLSSQSSSPGFGYSAGSGGDSTAQCG